MIDSIAISKVIINNTLMIKLLCTMRMRLAKGRHVKIKDIRKDVSRANTIGLSKFDWVEPSR